MKPEEYPSETFYKYTIVTGVLENFERKKKRCLLFGNACAGRVGKKFRCLRLSQEAWGLKSD